ncbi:NfeD family protein [Geminicoccus roseus]|uniref:NfeD family protein n=1 Tax=Geminicoccus roseus TaxID=404900 RepID=UPI0009FE2BAD
MLFCLLLVLPLAGAGQDAVQDPGRGGVVVLDVQGAIGPATAGYLANGLETAARREADLVVLRLDTPGGLSSSTREIILAMLASPVPIAVFVAPAGARAASAGTYMLYAAQLAAMAPGTHLGAATPIQLGAPAGSGGEEEGEDEAPADAATAKAVNDAVAQIRGLAELHGRNADWAEEAVREAATLTASAALDQQVIEIVAGDLDDLLRQADGRTVHLGGEDVTLATQGLAVVPIEPGWRLQALAVITDPNIAYILMLVGIYGIIFEFFSPGAIVPGTVGAIALIVALFALNLLPIDHAGAGLMLLGIALLVAEAFAPSFGVLGIGGAVAFGLGSLFLFEDVPGFQLSVPVVLVATGLSAVLIVVVLAAAIRAHRRSVVTGGPARVGASGRVLSWSGGRGRVHLHGEDWQARSASPLAPADRIRVTGRDGLVLLVEPDPSPDPQEPAPPCPPT